MLAFSIFNQKFIKTQLSLMTIHEYGNSEFEILIKHFSQS